MKNGIILPCGTRKKCKNYQKCFAENNATFNIREKTLVAHLLKGINWRLDDFAKFSDDRRRATKSLGELFYNVHSHECSFRGWEPNIFLKWSFQCK